MVFKNIEKFKQEYSIEAAGNSFDANSLDKEKWLLFDFVFLNFVPQAVSLYLDFLWHFKNVSLLLSPDAKKIFPDAEQSSRSCQYPYEKKKVLWHYIKLNRCYLKTWEVWIAWQKNLPLEKKQLILLMQKTVWIMSK